MSDPSPFPGLPARPSLEQLRKQAKELLQRARAGDAAAASRVGAVIPRLRDATALANIVLADAQFVIAREAGFENWAKLVRHLEAIGAATRWSRFDRPLIRPVELQGSRPLRLADGSTTTTDAAYEMFAATRDGDLDRVKALVARAPGLALYEHNYTPPIHFAVREGYVDLVRFCLERGADLAYRSYPFSDSLLMMAEDRDHAEVADLLRTRLSRRFAVAEGMGAILDAARSGDLAGVEAELARNPGLARASNETGDTALHQAAHNGHLHVVMGLLAAGAAVDAVRGDGFRPVHNALMPNWKARVPPDRARAIADALIARGARYTIFIAALLGDDRFVRDALARDASLANFEDTCHHRPISAAARRNDVAMTRLLLQHGADPNLPEEGAPRGHALWLAVYNKRYELARLLVEHGADPNAMVESSGTPMGHALKDPELLQLLLAHGGVIESTSDDRKRLEQLIDDRDLAGAERFVRAHPELLRLNDIYWGDGVLAGPASAGDHELISMLLRLGARVPQVSKWAPYYYFKHEATAAFLLQNGMDPNHMNWHRLTLLHHMAAEGEIAKARLLLDHGAEIDAVDEEYRSTALGLAARRGQRAAVSLLLERGADPNLAAAPWATPLAWAEKRGYADIVDTLRAAGASA
jgi:ankyrin repeat protein